MLIRLKQISPLTLAALVIFLEMTVTLVAAYFVHRSATPILQALYRHDRQIQSTIEFYGQVVDEANRPVANAKIVVELQSTKWSSQFGSEGNLPSNQSLILQTDGNGRFAVEGIEGYALGVEEIQKDGYEWVPQRTSNSDGQHFGYVATGGGQLWKFLSERSRPIIFHMRRQKTP